MEAGETLNNKKQIYQEMLGGDPDALYILSGGIMPITTSSGTTRYKQGSYADTEEHGLLSGGKARVIAAAELGEIFANATIVANSSVNPDEPTHAEVVADELKTYGISPERILKQEDSYSLFTELLQLLKMMKVNNWLRVGVVTNEFQIPRVREMLNQIQSLQDPKGEWKKEEYVEAKEDYKARQPDIRLISAEDVLPNRNKAYSKIIDTVRQSPEWKKRVEVEQNGANQLKEGTYWK